MTTTGTLTVRTTGAGSGTVTSDDGVITCGSAGATCSASYPDGTALTLAAAEDDARGRRTRPHQAVGPGWGVARPGSSPCYPEGWPLAGFRGFFLGGVRARSRPSRIRSSPYWNSLP